ncbi:MAG TPA: hypothetical protein VNV37_12465, partial [Solirubrobacteraceae bacterium]|nr:hypothetical protein [Solirubrobacteraceae bacterium]
DRRTSRTGSPTDAGGKVGGGWRADGGGVGGEEGEDARPSTARRGGDRGGGPAGPSAFRR